jgi:leucyl aminopeptidase
VVLPSFAQDAPVVDFVPTTATPVQIDSASLIAIPVLIGSQGPQVHFVDDIVSETGVDLLGVVVAATELDDAHPGSFVEIPVSSGLTEGQSLRSILLFGVDEGSPGQLRNAAGALARRTRGHREVTVCLRALDDDEQLRAFVEGFVLGGFTLSAREQQPSPIASKLNLVCSEQGARVRGVLERSTVQARAAWQARRLATMPSNVKSPRWLAGEVESLVKGHSIKVTEFDQERLAKEGFGGILAVGAGSASPPVMLQLDYRPRGADARRKDEHIVLVGKGITFDTGGLSIKPAEAMANMKRDMTGAAVVASVMSALHQLKCGVRVTALLPLAENSLSGSASRPGDVITHYGGRTTEITNTDAEGRLVLADAMAYAAKKLKPTTLVDIATLTGGAKVALGTRMGALFATNPELAASLGVAARDAGEPLWELPLSSEYEPKLASKVADAVNSSGGPPAITAALFLQRFVRGVEWAHLDIASSGDAEDDRFEWTKGPTGFGVRTLLRWLEQGDSAVVQSDSEGKQ